MKNLKTIGLLAFAAFALGACSKDDLAENGGIAPAEKVEVPVCLTIQELTDVASDKETSVASTDGSMDVQLVEAPVSTRAVDESGIGSLQVVQFIGNKVVAGYYAETYTTGGVSCPLVANSGSEKSIIYFIANLPQQAVNEGESLSDFEARTIDNLPVYLTSDTQKLPMVLKKEIAVSYSTPINEQLQRLYAKLIITIKNEGQLTQPSVTVRNIPTTARFGAAAPTGTTDLFPGDGKFQDKAISGFAFNTPFTLYVPENLQGTDTGITKASDKYGKNHTNGTYIELKGVRENVDLTYLIYLGKDNTSYNIERNHAYTITATIKGDNLKDNRVSGICNLSRKADGTASTAAADVGTNCYVVNKGGLEYKFLPFKGKGGTQVNGATYSVLWSAMPSKYATVSTQKVNDIIELVDTDAATSGVQPVDKEGYVHFKTVGSWGLLPMGNALIVAKVSDKIVWSWHIWSTNYNPNAATGATKLFKTKNTATGHTQYTVMNKLLGAIDGGKGQSYHNVALLYQWGRKDPFIPANIEEALVKGKTKTDVNFGGTSLKAADADSWDAVTTSAMAGLVSYAVEHPTTFIIGTSGNNNYDWIWATGADAAKKDELWGNPWVAGGTAINGVTVNKEIGTKSGYDPCPIGWRVAPQDAFTMFTKNGTNEDGAANKANWNVNNDVSAANQGFANGWTFYYSAWKSGDTIEWPASGLRSAGSGALVGPAGAWGGSWGSSPFAAGSPYASHLRFSTGDVKPMEGANRAYGLPVRCVKE